MNSVDPALLSASHPYTLFRHLPRVGVCGSSFFLFAPVFLMKRNPEVAGWWSGLWAHTQLIFPGHFPGTGSQLGYSGECEVPGFSDVAVGKPAPDPDADRDSSAQGVTD